MLQTLQAAMSSCPAGSAQQAPPSTQGVPASVLCKEAVYAAFAVGAYELHDYVEMSSWLRSALLLVSEVGPFLYVSCSRTITLHI